MKWTFFVLVLALAVVTVSSCTPGGKKDNSKEIEKVLLRLADISDGLVSQLDAIETKDKKAEDRAVLQIVSDALPQMLGIHKSMANLYKACPTKYNAHALLAVNSAIKGNLYVVLGCNAELRGSPKSERDGYAFRSKIAVAAVRDHMRIFKDRYFKQE